MAKYEARNNYWTEASGLSLTFEQVRKGDALKLDADPSAVRGPSVVKSCELALDSGKLQRLEKCIVGEARGCFDTSWLLANFSQQHVYDVWAVRVSAGQFIIDFDKEEARKSMEEDNWHWLGQWFHSFKPWSMEVVAVSRLVEVRVHGLPLVMWKKENLEKIAGLWGSLNTVECNVDNPEDARVCTFTLSTEKLERIDEKVTVKCGNGNYEIWVSETSRVVQWSDVEVFKEVSPFDWAEGERDKGYSSLVPTGEDEMVPDEVFRSWSVEEAGVRDRDNRVGVDVLHGSAWETAEFNRLGKEDNDQ